MTIDPASECGPSNLSQGDARKLSSSGQKAADVESNYLPGHHKFHRPRIGILWLTFMLVLGGGLTWSLCCLVGAAAVGEGGLDVEPFQELVRSIIAREIKEKYEDKKHWGQTATVEHIRVKGKWFEPRVEKYDAEVNDGLWQRAEITLVEPDKNLKVNVATEPATTPGRTGFALQLSAKISGEAHVERWRKGIKMFNTSVLFDATVTARVHCDVAIRREPGQWIDDVVLDPKVTAIDLNLDEFELRKLGVLGRDAARELSDPLKPFIERELKRREGKIVDKANASIDKQRAKLRFSTSKFVSTEWAKISDKISTAAGIGTGN